MRIKILGALALALSLGACTFDEAMQKVDAAIGRTNTAVEKYAPVIGRDLVMVANVVVTAECSPLVPIASKEAGNLLNVVAPDTKSAATVSNFLARNEAIASQLCPLVAAIKTEIGKVPAGQPSQVVAVPAA